MERHQQNSNGLKPSDNASPVDGQTPTESEPIWCSLSPTCAPPNEPRCFHSLGDLQAHYASCHAFVCPEDACTCLFSSEHFLHLHGTEMHDIDAMRRKEAGEAIYRCLLENCPLAFVSPAQRRKHLVQDHGFDQRFFFSVIKYGIGEHLRAWATQTSESRPPEQPQAQTSKPSKTSPTRHRSENRHHIHEYTVPHHSAVKRPSNRSRINNHHESSMASLTQSMSKVSVHTHNRNTNGHGSSMGRYQRRVFTQNRNASAPDIHGSISDMDMDSTTDEDVETEEAGESSPERAGVRFAEEVAIRFMSPIDRRYGRFTRPRGGGTTSNGVRRGGQPNRGGGGGAGHHSRRTGRTGGVYSDSETSGRRGVSGEPRQSGYRGRARARTRPTPDRTQQQHS